MAEGGRDVTERAEPPLSSASSVASDQSEGSARPGDQDELLRLASVIAHQLKSPLSSVETVLATVLGGFAGPLETRQRWLLEKARERCARGTHLVRDLLRLRTVDRLDDDSLGPVNLATAMRAAVAQTMDLATEKQVKVELSVELPDVDAAWVHGDAALIHEIIDVLLDNAVKYSPERGVVSVRLVLTESGDASDQSWLRVEVVDSGIGIPPEGYSQLFREFYRAPNAKHLAADGSGLGLAFAWRAARRMGGAVALEPAPTGGVRATVGFPQRLDYCAAETGAALEGTAGGSERAVSQRVVIVGGVTAGSKAAARLMRLDGDADVTIVERGRFLAYSGCGLPYYVSGTVSDQRSLLETPLGAVRDPAFFHRLKNVRALDLTEAVSIDRERKRLVVRNLLDDRQRELPYDRLILATGARAVRPELPGVDLPGIHTLHGVEDAEAIKALLARPRAHDVVILGAGLLGCQITESMSLQGARLTLVEQRPSILSLVDEELAALVQQHLESHGVRVLCGTTVAGFSGDERVREVLLEDGTRLPCDLVLLSLGRRPEVRLAAAAGLELGPTGAIRVDRQLGTSDPCILAAGDCAEQLHAVTGQPTWIPGAVPATLQGRVAAGNVCGRQEEAPPVTGAFIVKLFDWTAARVGLVEREAREAGFDPVVALIPGPDRAHFLPTARDIVFKLIVDRSSGRVLGAQGVGAGDVAKRVDVVATALAAGLDVHQLASLTLAYAPPFAMAMDTVVTAANVVRNKMDGIFHSISAVELRQRLMAADPPFLLDVRQPAEFDQERLRGSRHVPLGNLRSRLREIPRERMIVVICSLGLRSYEASRVLAANGFADVVVLDGGLHSWPYTLERLT